jgi:hypothetical protein
MVKKHINMGSFHQILFDNPDYQLYLSVINPSLHKSTNRIFPRISRTVQQALLKFDKGDFH